MAGRTDTEIARNENFTRLEGKAKRDSDKVALNIFKDAVSKNVTARRAKTEEAKKVLNEATVKITEARKTALNTAKDTFITASQNALTQAQSSCASAVDAKTVKTSYNSTMNKARTAFEKVRKTTTSKEMLALKKVFKESVKKADEDLRAINLNARTKMVTEMMKK